MRTTIDLPEDLHRIASAIARDTGKSLSRTIADLARRGLSSGVGEGETPSYRVDGRTGLPVVRSRRVITADDVRHVENHVWISRHDPASYSWQFQFP